jgi:protocatechuate 3,4-dioxygenase beta subunit
MQSPRRQFLQQSLAGAFVVGCGSPGRRLEPGTPSFASPSSQAADLAPSRPVYAGTAPPASPVCSLTEPNIEGPFFKADAPFRASRAARNHASLVDGHEAGTPLEVSGRVLGRDCEPIVGALIEVWHADHAGAYDHHGFDFRGRFRSGADGLYRLRTIVPGHYRAGDGFRPAHIHVKVHVPGSPSLTTQLYFPDDPHNESDPFIRPSLIMALAHDADGARARFDFTV